MNDRRDPRQLFKTVTADVFRLAARDGMTVNRLSLLTEIPAQTMGTWARGEASIPGWALSEICEHIPDSITSLWFERPKKFLGTLDQDGEPACLDTVGREAVGFTSALLNAKDPAGPGGAAVTHIERGQLRDKARKLASVARAIAA